MLSPLSTLIMFTFTVSQNKKSRGAWPGFIHQMLLTGSDLLLPPLNQKTVFSPYLSFPFIYALLSSHSPSFPRILENFLKLFFRKMITKIFQNPRTQYIKTCSFSDVPIGPHNIIRKRLQQSLPHIYPNFSITYNYSTLTHSIRFNILYLLDGSIS